VNLDEAIRLRDPARLPSHRDEDWRWTDLRGLLRTIPEPSRPLAAGTAGLGPFDGLTEETLLVANGSGPEEIRIAGGETRTLALRHISRGDGAHSARLRIEVGPSARLTLLESHEGGGAGLSLLGIDLHLGADAACERLVLADMDPEAVAVVELDANLEAGARLSQTLLTAGARRQRFETRVRHPGQGAEVRLDGLDARMTHNALILSDRAEVDARPELEIYADDVACAHGATVGALDDEVLFDMRQRGLPEREARSLLVASFLGEVIDRVGSPAAAERMRGWVQARIGAEG